MKGGEIQANCQNRRGINFAIVRFGKCNTWILLLSDCQLFTMFKAGLSFIIIVEQKSTKKVQ